MASGCVPGSGGRRAGSGRRSCKNLSDCPSIIGTVGNYETGRQQKFFVCYLKKVDQTLIRL